MEGARHYGGETRRPQVMNRRAFLCPEATIRGQIGPSKGRARTPDVATTKVPAGAPGADVREALVGVGDKTRLHRRGGPTRPEKLGPFASARPLRRLGHDPMKNPAGPVEIDRERPRQILQRISHFAAAQTPKERLEIGPAPLPREPRGDVCYGAGPRALSGGRRCQNSSESNRVVLFHIVPLMSARCEG